MKPKLYVVHGSHPCAAVERAAELKGVAVDRVELPPPAHALITKALGFPARTVPAMKIGTEKLSGSSAIMRRLDALAPEPPMYPADPAARAAVGRAERFDDDVLQPLVRRLIWTANKRYPKALPTYTVNSRLKPSLPAPLIVAAGPLISRIELKMHAGDDETARADLAALPGHLDQVDAWIADGTLGGDPPNAADLRLGASLRLLTVLADLAPVLAGHACVVRARELFPLWDGAVPVGVLPKDWIPAPRPAGAPAPA